jgi:hypothetical protein
MSRFILNKVARVVEGRDLKAETISSDTFSAVNLHIRVSPPRDASSRCISFIRLTLLIRPSHCRRLPLYYSFPYNAGACGYRIKSEAEIEVLCMETKKVEQDFPYSDYPLEFPERPVRLAPISYEQHKSLVYYIEADDKSALSDADQRLIFQDYHYPFTQLGGIHRMLQGIPNVSCPNTLCEYSKYECFMDVFAVVWNEPHSGVFLWDAETPDGCDVQVIFQSCPKCHSIHACNRCT